MDKEDDMRSKVYQLSAITKYGVRCEICGQWVTSCVLINSERACDRCSRSLMSSIQGLVCRQADLASHVRSIMRRVRSESKDR